MAIPAMAAASRQPTAKRTMMRYRRRDLLPSPGAFPSGSSQPGPASSHPAPGGTSARQAAEPVRQWSAGGSCRTGLLGHGPASLGFGNRLSATRLDAANHHVADGGQPRQRHLLAAAALPAPPPTGARTAAAAGTRTNAGQHTRQHVTEDEGHSCRDRQPTLYQTGDGHDVRGADQVLLLVLAETSR